MGKTRLPVLVFFVFVIYACSKETATTPAPTPVPTATNIHICPLCFITAPPPEILPTSVINLIEKDDQHFLLIEDQRRPVLIHSDRAVVENCLGISDVSQGFNFSQASTSSIEMGAEFSTTGGIKDILQLSVATHYNLNLSETKTYETNVSFIALAGYRVIYTVEWYEVWIEGRVFPVEDLHQGNRNEYTYRAKIGVESRIPNPIPEACAPTATSTLSPTPEPTFTPTPTPTLVPSSTNTLEPPTPEPTTTP